MLVFLGIIMSKNSWGWELHSPQVEINLTSPPQPLFLRLIFHLLERLNHNLKSENELIANGRRTLLF